MLIPVPGGHSSWRCLGCFGMEQKQCPKGWSEGFRYTVSAQYMLGEALEEVAASGGRPACSMPSSSAVSPAALPMPRTQCARCHGYKRLYLPEPTHPLPLVAQSLTSAGSCEAASLKKFWGHRLDKGWRAQARRGLLPKQGTGSQLTYPKPREHGTPLHLQGRGVGRRRDSVPEYLLTPRSLAEALPALCSVLCC